MVDGLHAKTLCGHSCQQWHCNQQAARATLTRVEHAEAQEEGAVRQTMPPRKLVAAWADNQPIVDALCKALEGALPARLA